MNNIAIILARQHSKGIPLKNLQPVGGISLLGRAILSAQQSRIFSRIVVSTDGDLIAAEAQKYHPITLIKRPDELANDTATSIAGVLHVLQELNITDGVMCLLQPTSPLRTAAHIREAYRRFGLQQLQGSVVSASVCGHHPYKCLIKNDDGQYQPVHLLTDLESPRQKLPAAFRPNGAIYFSDIPALIGNRRFFNDPISLYEMNNADSIDIDTQQDLMAANRLLDRV